jgi:hypothetical protein
VINDFRTCRMSGKSGSFARDRCPSFALPPSAFGRIVVLRIELEVKGRVELVTYVMRGDDNIARSLCNALRCTFGIGSVLLETRMSNFVQSSLGKSAYSVGSAAPLVPIRLSTCFLNFARK